MPRNKGIELARGKYLYFVDSDDGLTNTALAELYTAAENFQADVVHCEKHFRVEDENFTTDPNFLTAINIFTKVELVTAPTFMTDNISERLDDFVEAKFDWSTCNNFIRRDLVTRNNLKFPAMKMCEDSIFTIYLLCLARKILRIPSAFYIYRQRANSLSRYKIHIVEDIMSRWGEFFFKGFATLDKFFSKQKFCDNQLEKKSSIFLNFAQWRLDELSIVYEKYPFSEIDKIVRRYLEKLDDAVAPAAFFFGCANLLKLDLNKQQQMVNMLHSALEQEQQKNDSLIEVTKKQRDLINYQRVEIQNLKSVFSPNDAE